jgi:hypothetical protein
LAVFLSCGADEALAQAAPNGWAGQSLSTSLTGADGTQYNQQFQQSYSQEALPTCFTTSSQVVGNGACSASQAAAGDYTAASTIFAPASSKATQSTLPAAVVAPGSQAVVNVQGEYADSQSPSGVSYVNASIPLGAFATASSVSAETSRATAAEASIADTAATTGKGLAAALGGGAAVGANGQVTAPSYLIQGATYANVGAALAAEDSAVTSTSASVAALTSAVGTLTTRLNALQQYAVESRTEARQGIASAMAMTSASMPSAPGRTSWVVNVSDYRDQQAFGASMAHRFDFHIPVAMTAGFAVSGGGETGVRVGLAGEF